jgi:glyoxylase-like metal-dependent hydrolase (beta-lactamase superfamily II)
MLIDCGVDWDPGRSRLLDGLEQLGVMPADVDALVVSHLHPDHVGMAPSITEEYGWPLVMHERARDLFRRYNDTPGLRTSTLRLATLHGTPGDALDAVADVGTRPDFMPMMRPPDMVTTDGDSIDLGNRSLEVVHTPGHEQAHICLRDSRTGVTFSGDHVLPRITPVIMYDEEADDVLGDYLSSLDRLIALDIGLTYPAHGIVVERGVARCEQIKLHHDRRLAGMLEVVRLGPTTAWSVMGEVYRPNLAASDQRLALRETVSHLEHLRIRGTIISFEDDAVRHYRA